MNKHRHIKTRKAEQGVAIVEFGLITIVFFTLLLGIIEFGRFMYLWNTVQEVTRIAAREAVVSDIISDENRDDEIDRIQRAAIFRIGSTGDSYLPAGGEVSNSHVNIRYLNVNKDPIDDGDMPDNPADNMAACLDADRMNDECIRYVEVSICQQQDGHGNDDGECTPVAYKPMIGLFTFLDINIPPSTVVMPAESLGYQP